MMQLEIQLIPSRIWLKCVSKGLVDKKSSLVQVIQLDAVRQQAIAWTNVDQDPWCHMASLDPSANIVEV